MKLNKEVGALITIFVMLFAGFAYPLTLMLGNEELSNTEISFNLFLFSTILIVGSVGALLIYFTRYVWKKEDKYGNSFGLFNIGEKPSFSFFKNFTAPQLYLGSLIIFLSVFLSANFLKASGFITSNSFTSTITLPQQFSRIDSLLFSTFLTPIAEEALNIFVLGALVVILVVTSYKLKIKPSDFKYYYFILIPTISAGLAVIWHINAYSGSDIARWSVFFFWLIKNFLILATGFVFVGINMHQVNNFFIDFPRLFSNDVVTTTVIAIIMGLSVLYYYLYRGNLLGGGKKRGAIIS